MQSFGSGTARGQLEDLGIRRITNWCWRNRNERWETDFSVSIGGLCESSAYMKYWIFLD